jgi:hypothetical protein
MFFLLADSLSAIVTEKFHSSDIRDYFLCDENMMLYACVCNTMLPSFFSSQDE